MQDRFKFRVWHKKRKQMYEVLHLHTETWTNGGEWVTAKGFNIITQQDIHIQIEPKDGVIMQCTGLKDKNGKLIYEGDIINIWCKNFTKNQISEVKFCKERAAFTFDYNTDLCNIVPCTMEKTEIEVIGNIYENPELLEVENE